MDHFLNIRTFYPVLFRLQSARGQSACGRQQLCSGGHRVPRSPTHSQPPAPLGGFAEYEVISEKEDGDRARVDVRLTDIAGGETADFVFSMEKQNFGSYKGCWLTKSLLPADSKWLS